MSSLSADAAVIGLGPAGAAAALTLLQAGLRVIAFDCPRQGPVLGETVPPAILPLLEQLGLATRFLEECPKIESAGVASCWGSPVPAFQDYIQQPGGRGWHVDRRAFNRILREAVAAGGAVTANERLSDIVLPGRMTVIATGRGSFPNPAGAGQPQIVDHLTALARYWNADDGGAYALIEAHAEGWCYSAPQPGGRMVTALFTNPVALRDAECWRRVLPGLSETRARLHEAKPASGWMVASARTARRLRVVGDGYIAAGDAAASWDPLSGAGIVRALGSGMAAARTVIRHLSGNESALSEYQDACDEQFMDYLRKRQAYYISEGRWPDSPFWRARREAVSHEGFSRAPPSLG